MRLARTRRLVVRGRVGIVGKVPDRPVEHLLMGLLVGRYGRGDDELDDLMLGRSVVDGQSYCNKMDAGGQTTLYTSDVARNCA